MRFLLLALLAGCAARNVEPDAPARVQWVISETEPVTDPQTAKATLDLGMNMALMDPDIPLQIAQEGEQVRTSGVLEVRVGPSAVHGGEGAEILELPVSASLVDERGRTIRHAELSCRAEGNFTVHPQFALTGVSAPGPSAWRDDVGAVIELGRTCGEQLVRELHARR